ncbi:MAG: YkvA family protein [Hyphomonadaceae bacterium]
MRQGLHLGVFAEAAAIVAAVLDRRTPWGPKLLAAGALIYLVNPFDLLPDVLPLAGWIDDAAVAPALLWLASRFVPKEAMARARQRFAKRDKKSRAPAE